MFKNNSIGFVPNSENPSDPPPPQDGACNSGKNRKATPTFSSTEIARCTIFRNDAFEENNNINAPGNNATEGGGWGIGVEQGCQNSTTPNPENGFAAVEYILELQAESQARTPTPQPAPPAQPTMPNPCQGVPYNSLCQ